MTRLYEAAALAYGLVTLILLTAVAAGFHDVFAVKCMVGAMVAAYACQVFTAWTTFWPAERWINWLGLVAWAISVAFGGAAIWSMVL